MNLSLAVFIYLRSICLSIHLQKDARMQFYLFYLAQKPQCTEYSFSLSVLEITEKYLKTYVLMKLIKKIQYC